MTPLLGASGLELHLIDKDEFRARVAAGPVRELALRWARVRQAPDYLEAAIEQVEAEQACVFAFQFGNRLIALAICQIHTGNGSRTFHILELSGDGVVALLPAFERYAVFLAHAFECEMVTLAGRRGWRRLFQRLGWTMINEDHIGKAV